MADNGPTQGEFAHTHTHTLPAKRNPEDGFVIYANGEIRNANGALTRPGASSVSGAPEFNHRSPHHSFKNSDWPVIGGSDGRNSAFTMIDTYYRHGYSILALTDHNRVSWPWNYFGINSKTYQMLAVKGSEPSGHHHIGNYFSDFSGAGQRDVELSIAEIGERGGLSVIFHPGRYDWKIQDYVRLYKKFDHLVGMEVYNQSDGYPGDRETWDSVLKELMPDRPVWGYSNDDAHFILSIARSWEVFFLEDLSEQSIRQAMQTGRFYFCHSPEKDGEVPVIHSINVENGIIKIDASGYENIEWVFDYKTVQRGTECLAVNLPKNANYVRARLVGTSGFTYTQPFGIKR